MTMAEYQKKTALVVSAHSGDFVWRAGGAIALYAGRGWQVKIVCLSFGERGESAKLWREDGMTLEKVKTLREEEARKAASILGGDIEFFDCGDYPLNFTAAHMDRLVDIYRSLQPRFVLTHSLADPYNFDHPQAAHIVQEARIIAQAHGHQPAGTVLGAPPVFLFEPHQPEQCGWKPEVLLDITPVWDVKRKAFETMAAQEYLWEYYTRVALNRGVQAARNSEMKNIRYAEAYQRVFPMVTAELNP
jgi:4-oxalomesaconate hydratase